MNINAKVDWVGTPRRYTYVENEIEYDALSIDFTLQDDDERYKLLILKYEQETRYEIKQYRVKPGKQKPYPVDTDYVFTNKTIPLIDTILQDPYVQSYFGQTQA
ncbi:DUF3910 family protein [Microbacteriaceae bacterium 4G12]